MAVIAAEHSIPFVMVERGDYGPGFDRGAYTSRLASALAGHGADTVAMAGFKTVLSAPIIDGLGGRVLNTHPSMLPEFPGPDAAADALAAGVEMTGCTVHVAEVDAGPILAFQPVPVFAGDTEATLHARIKAAERLLYPPTIAAFAA